MRHHLLAKWHWDLARPKKGSPPGTIDLVPRNRIAQVGVEKPLFVSFERTRFNTRIPSSVSEISKSTDRL